MSFPGCPKAAAARTALARALEAEGLPADFEEIRAESRWGSPTILIDGIDAAGERSPDGSCCRLHPGDEDQIRRALRSARP